MKRGSVALIVPPEDRKFVEAEIAPRRSGIRIVSGPALPATTDRDRDLSLLFIRSGTLLGSPGPVTELVLDYWAADPRGSVVFFEGKEKETKLQTRFHQLVFEFAAQRPPRARSYIAPDPAAVRRLVLARQHGAEDQLIASARYENGMLKVWSCEPRLYRCPVAKIPALAALSEEQRHRLSVSESGSRLHWPDGDIDLDLSSLKTIADPRFLEQKRRQFREEAARYGSAIRTLREKHGLRQRDIEGLSARELRRLEKGETFPHGGTIAKLAMAHGMSAGEYLAKLAAIERRGS